MTTGQGIIRLLACYEKIPKEKMAPFSRQASVHDFFKPSSGFVTENYIGRCRRSDEARTEQDEKCSTYIKESLNQRVPGGLGSQIS